MSRFDFMRKLEELLSDIPPEERAEALKYYNDYFDDAGVLNEANIIRELETPERIASIIKADLRAEGDSNHDRGMFTERGYEDTVYEEKKFEVIKPGDKSQGKDGNSRKYYNDKSRNDKSYTRNTNIALIILICLFALPIGLPIIISIFAIALAIILTLAGVIFGITIAGVVMVPVGVILVFVGLFNMGIPYTGLAICGSGLLLFGIGILFVLLSVLLYKTVVPAIIRAIVYIGRLPFKNRRVSV